MRNSAPLRTSFLLRRFSVYYLVFALIPLLILLHMYLQQEMTGNSPGQSRQQIAILIALLGIASLLSYFAMRRILAKIVFLVLELQKIMSGKLNRWSVDQLSQEEGEVSELAQCFSALVDRLESNIEELEETKLALHRTMFKIGNAVSSIQDFNVLLGFLLDTAVDALGARAGAVFSSQDGGVHLEAISAHSQISKGRLIKVLVPVLSLVETEKRLWVIHRDNRSSEDNAEALPTPVVCSPLLLQGKFRGAFALCGNRQDKDYTPDQLDLIAALSSQMATLFENSKLIEERERTYFETMNMLAQAVEARDRYSCGHSRRVREYSVLVAGALGLSADEIQTLADAAELHDVGKIGISDTILRKPGPLSDEEYSVMRQHTVIGESIVKPLKTFHHVLEPIRHHHEFLDGSGYPDRIKGENIPLITRVLTVADIYDALTSKRPYRDSMDRSKALKTLDEMVDQGKLDSRVVSTLTRVLSNQASAPKLPEKQATRVTTESQVNLVDLNLPNDFLVN